MLVVRHRLVVYPGIKVVELPHLGAKIDLAVRVNDVGLVLRH